MINEIASIVKANMPKHQYCNLRICATLTFTSKYIKLLGNYPHFWLKTVKLLRYTFPREN